MWQKIASFILRNRLFLLLGLVGLTGFMAYQIDKVKVSYDFHKVVPDENPKSIAYENFKKTFGEEGNILFVAIQKEDFFQLDFFNGWYALADSIQAIDGIENVLSVHNAVNFKKNSKEKRFEFAPLLSERPTSQNQVDSVKAVLEELPFYKNLLYNDSSTYLMAVTVNPDKMDSKRRITIVEDITVLLERFEERQQTELHYSGLPFIRSYKTTVISAEISKFLAFAAAITMIILFLLFRSFSAVIYPMLVIGAGVICSLGMMALMGYKMNVLTGIIPTLIVVIGVPNCVYLLNKYHTDFKRHGNKIKALASIIEKIGYVTFFTNLTTAIGFLVFAFTNVQVLKEFGLIAGLNISATFLISLISIPVIFSYLPKPKTRHTNHLDNKIFNFLVLRFDKWSQHHPKRIIAVACVIVAAASVGVFKLNAGGYILDDISKNAKVYKDLRFFETHFNGVMPFEILITKRRIVTERIDTLYRPRIDTIKVPVEDSFAFEYVEVLDTVINSTYDTSSAKVTGLSTLQRIAEAQDTLAKYPVFSRSLSMLEALKFARQAYYNGKSKYYELPDLNRLTSNDKKVQEYLENTSLETGITENTFLAEDERLARISVQMADIGSDSIPKLIADLDKKFKKIFEKDLYDYAFTGTSVMVLEGFNYLINGLIWSVVLAFLLIAGIMALLFRSLKMLLIALIPNLVPLTLTAAIMGYFGISLKPSTVLIFSIAFGISVDFTIHFLAKYRQELYRQSWNIANTVSVTLRETGFSMIYTFLILFCGFIIFTGSKFYGTAYLGLLTSITLIVSLFCNMLLVPVLILMIEGRGKKKRAKQ